MSSSKQVVTSVGNSWIICRSKTYAGRIYYFNTLTGEAAWNLSESEIEKAKKRTSVLESQTGFQADNCPEPKDSPKDLLTEIPLHSSKQKMPSQNFVPSKVYNKQIINNQFTEPNLPTGTFNSMSSVNPIQYSMAINPNINPNVWNFNPQPIFVTPNLLNHQSLQNTFNNNDYVPVTNTSVPLSNRFKHFYENLRWKRDNNGNSFRGRKNYCRNRFSNMRTPMDLRHILSLKKRKPNNSFTVAEDFQQQQIEAQSSNIQSTEKRSIFHQLITCDDVDDDVWLEENENRTQSSKDSIDISPLRKFLHVENSFNIWYIVLDSNVILNNITFLKILLISDNQCRLMVPQAVMNKIQMATNSSLRTQAHRSAYFILQQVDANRAIIDKEECNDDRTAILNCCTKLTERGCPMVLLTDDLEFHNLEDSTRFKVLTVKQVKNILTKTVSNVPKSNSLEDLPLSQSRSIVITIPNNVNESILNHVQENEYEVDTVHPTDEYSELSNVSKDSESNNMVEINEHKNSDVVDAPTNTINLIQGANDKLLDSSSNNTEKMLYENTRPTVNQTLFNSLNTKPDTEKQKYLEKKLRKKIISILTKGAESDIASGENHLLNDKLSSYVSNDSLHQNFSSDRDILVHKSLSDSAVEKKATEEFNIRKNVKLNATNENEISNSAKEKKLPKNREIEDQNVMFEVTSRDMEECLNRKCDEFISRFVQIIEEASTEVLQQDPPFILDTMPPPWTIYEATECIKRKFHNDNDIVDAANKLLNVLFEIGGLRGKLKMNISPHKYMEMYSYGVYLIDALQGLFNNSEDLQIAEESLSKLLSDIQNTNINSEGRFEDSFTDVLPETEDKVGQEMPSKDAEKTKLVHPILDKTSTQSDNEIVTFTNKTPVKKAKTESNSSSPGNYNLRSQRKKLFQEQGKISEKTKFIRNIDPEASFFISLRLQRNENINVDLNVNTQIDEDGNKEDTEGTKEDIETGRKNEETDTESNREDIETGGKKEDNDIESNREDIETEGKKEDTNAEGNKEDIETGGINEYTDNSEQDNLIPNGPKVIRNFSLCPEIENRLKEKQMVYDSWISKNSAYRNESISEETEEFDYESMENEYYGCDYDMYDDEDMSEVNSSDRYIENEENAITPDKTNVYFKDIVGKIEHNLRETFSSVHKFCEKCYTTLTSNDRKSKKQEMRHVAEKTYLYLNNLCEALSSILSRESSDSAYRIQELLKLEELRDIVLEDDDLECYRTFVTKCIEQGNVLKDSVQLVIEASRK